MPTYSSTDDVIESLVHIYCEQADARTQYFFRQSLYHLVHLAQQEQAAAGRPEAWQAIAGRLRTVVTAQR